MLAVKEKKGLGGLFSFWLSRGKKKIDQ